MVICKGPFTIPYGDHKRNVKSPYITDADKHFTLQDHNFSVNAVFAFIERSIKRLTVPLEILKKRLENTNILNKKTEGSNSYRTQLRGKLNPINKIHRIKHFS